MMPTQAEIENVAAAIWPWVGCGLDLKIPWREVNKGSAAHEIACDCARAAILAMRGVAG